MHGFIDVFHPQCLILMRCNIPKARHGFSGNKRVSPSAVSRKILDKLSDIDDRHPYGSHQHFLLQKLFQGLISDLSCAMLISLSTFYIMI